MQPAGIPPFVLIIAPVSVPPPRSTSFCTGMPLSCAHCSIKRLTPTGTITEASMTFIAGPFPHLTDIGEHFGVSPVSVTSRFTQKSGEIECAATPAPRRPTSSCTVNTAYTSCSLTHVLKHSATIAQQSLSSSAPQEIRLPSSVKLAAYTAISPISTFFSASSRDDAPMSIKSFCIVASAAPPFSVSKYVTPRVPFSNTTSRAIAIMGLTPPTLLTRKKPFSSISVTISPI